MEYTPDMEHCCIGEVKYPVYNKEMGILDKDVSCKCQNTRYLYNGEERENTR
jgi:hypothetical protein